MPPPAQPESSSGRGGHAPPPAGAFDEVLDPAGRVRPHWEPFFADIPDPAGPEFARRWRDAQQVIRENGVTYNVHGDPNGLQRPWQLDPLPLVLTAADAAHIERGLVQRAALLELILADLHGPRQFIADGLIPAELIFANPNYLRPLHDLRPPLNRYLHLYAANLGRAGDGTWTVIRDRTQSPSGAGYALENRIVASRTLPEAFENCRIQRMASFFQTLMNGLRAIAPKNRDNPRIVLLTPGPTDEAYFEHSYLARYLGVTLAEGGDLTVRDRYLYLKVLGGLQTVDVLFRRLDDDQCDPLELRSDSFLGVPGLVQAIRAGTVATANALGAGAVEMPAMMAYLPNLCRTVLGEELKLASVPTWWCGDPVSLKYVLNRPTELVLKSTFPTANRTSILLDECTADERAAHLDRLRAEPHKYVAQQLLPLSTVPVYDKLPADRRRMVLRAFLASGDDGAFHMLPGGLTCFGGNPASRSVSMPLGGGSKDTWVLADGPVNTFSMLPPGDRPIALTRGGGDLPSRAADNLFWLGRYAERAESATRLLRAAVTRLADRSSPTDPPEVAPLLRAVVARLPAVAPVAGQQPPSVRDPLPLIYSTDRKDGLRAAVTHWHRVAGIVRDRISADMWRVVSGVRRVLVAPDAPPTAAEVLDLLDRVLVYLSAFGGLATENMTRGEGWRFLDLGRKLERSMNLVTLTATTLCRPPESEAGLLDAVLEVADARMTYRRRYLGQLRAKAVLDLVLFDETNPRSLASLLLAVRDDVALLPRALAAEPQSPELRLALQAVAAVQLADVGQLAVTTDGARPQLVELLARVGELLPALSDALTLHYLSHLQIARHLAQGDAS